MAMDTPARIAIVGAGPIGLEAALYARFLGYDVDVYEAQQVAQHVRRWGHVPMVSPFGLNCTPLALAALQCQDRSYAHPDEEVLLTGNEFAERYLLPLSRTDLLADSLHQQTSVVSIAREPMPEEGVNDALEPEEVRFRLLLRTADGQQREATADIVIDASGTFANPSGLAPDGTSVAGEQECKEAIEYGIPDVLAVDRARYARRHTLVVGTDQAAAGIIVALAELAVQEPDTRVTWITDSTSDSGPFAVDEADPLLARQQQAASANRLATAKVSSIDHLPGIQIVRVEQQPAGAGPVVELGGSGPQQTLEVDQIVAANGYQPDLSICSQLSFPGGYPMEGIAAVATPGDVDWPGQVDLLITAEPNFYWLGAKSFGRHSHFALRMGHRQIVALFALIGENPNLNLYQSPLPT